MSDKFTLKKFDAFCKNIDDTAVQPYYLVLPKPLIDDGVSHKVITKDDDKLNFCGATVIQEKEVL